MKRIYSLDLFKLLFAYTIALGHFGVAVPPGATATVQIFFIISGFFLAKKFYSRKNADPNYTAWRYTIDHVRSLYPHYAFSLVILALYYLLQKTVVFLAQPSFSTAASIGTLIHGLIPEFLLLQNSGVFQGGINYPLWQVCVLVISSYFVYCLLYFDEKRSRQLIFPAAILMIQACLNTDADIWGTFTFFHTPLLRAFSPLCIGVLTYHFTTTEYYSRFLQHPVLFNCASVLSLLFIFLFEDRQNVFLITFVVVLLAFYEPSSWFNRLFNKKAFQHFGVFSYAIYLNHALIIIVLESHIFPLLQTLFEQALSMYIRVALYLICLTVYSMITLWLVGKLKNAFTKKHAGSPS